MLVGDVVTNLFFRLLQPNQLERLQEVSAATHSALGQSILLSQRVGPLEVEPTLDLLHVDLLHVNLLHVNLLQRARLPIPADLLSLPLFHLFRGAVVVANLLIPVAGFIKNRRCMF